MSSRGVTRMPRRLPTVELKMAAASLPPTTEVRMTALDTGGGMQATTRRPGCRKEKPEEGKAEVKERGSRKRKQRRKRRTTGRRRRRSVAKSSEGSVFALKLKTVVLSSIGYCHS